MGRPGKFGAMWRQILVCGVIRLATDQCKIWHILVGTQSKGRSLELHSGIEDLSALIHVMYSRKNMATA